MTRDPSGPIGVARYDVEMAWAGVQTFDKLPLCLTPADLRAGDIDIAIGGVPWDGTNMDLPGARLAPRAIRGSGDSPSPPYGRPHQHVRVDAFEHLKVCDYGDADVVIGDSERTFRNIESFASAMLDGGALPVFLGGDHGITWPLVTAIAKKYGYGKVGIVQFDTHTDTLDELQGTVYSHATPMRMLIERGVVKGEHLVQIGLRGYWPGDDILSWMDEQGIKTHFMAEIERDGFDVVLDRAIAEALDGADHIYVSFDIDAVDPAYAPGTGAPEPGGLTSHEALRGMRRLAAEVGIVGFDVVEVNPLCDAGNGITSVLAHRIVLEGITGITMRRLGVTTPGYTHERALSAARKNRSPAA